MSGYHRQIGLEILCQLALEHKAFCSCAPGEVVEPNTRICPICIGLPGTLPIVNPAMIAPAVRACLALDARIADRLGFDRKNYFSPDLPKGYQITQYFKPLGRQGKLKVDLEDGPRKTVPLTRIYLEEDIGKTVHDPSSGASLIDFNRCGIAMIKVVTEPVLGSGAEAKATVRTLANLLAYLGICHGDVAKAKIRCNAEVSLSTDSSRGLKVELKNIDSPKLLHKAIDVEIERQIAILKDGGRIEAETRSFKWRGSRMVSSRKKGSNEDYRYLPEPNLPIWRLDRDYIEHLGVSMPKLSDLGTAGVLRQSKIDW